MRVIQNGAKVDAKVMDCRLKVCSVCAVVALQSRNGAIVGLETPDGDQTFSEKQSNLTKSVTKSKLKDT